MILPVHCTWLALPVPFECWSGNTVRHFRVLSKPVRWVKPSDRQGVYVAILKRFFRVLQLTILLAVFLIPQQTAQAFIYWQGKVTTTRVNRETVKKWLDVNGEIGLYDGYSFSFEKREIRFEYDGVINETVEYRTYSEEPWLCEISPGSFTWHVGKLIRSMKGFSSYPNTMYLVEVTDDFAGVRNVYPYSYSVVNYHMTYILCGVEYQWEGSSSVVAPWYLSKDEADFSADSLIVFGSSEDGWYWPDNTRGGYTRETSVVIYDLKKYDTQHNWFEPEYKQAFAESADLLDDFGLVHGLASAGVEKKLAGRVALGQALTVVGGAMDLASFMDSKLAEDPPDPNFTEIAVPITPTTHLQPFTTAEDLTQAEGDAFNALLDNLQQGIGLARVMLTCFDRAVGATDANEPYWVQQQLQAARQYAGQYADLLDVRPQLMENLKLALEADPDLPLEISYDDLSEYYSNLVMNGFSADQDQLLTEMGVNDHDKLGIYHAAMLADYEGENLGQDPAVQYPAVLSDPGLVQATEAMANGLRDFAEGREWKVFLPLLVR